MSRQRTRQRVNVPDTAAPDASDSLTSSATPDIQRSANAEKLAATTEKLIPAKASPRWKNWWVRTWWTLIMIASFFAIIASGPVTMILLVLTVQVSVFNEVISLASVPNRERRLPWSRALNWYFLLGTNYYLYGESIIYYFADLVFVDRYLQPLATHHRFISFSLYIFGFVWFVANLQKGHYRFQFSQFAWTHMMLLLVVVTSHCVINNIFEGLIWFFLPIALVITNDIFAYIFGFFFGRTPLIQLSPKKTWEGFVGGWLSTMVVGVVMSSILSRFPYMYCPIKDVTMNAFSGVQCDKNPIFIPHIYQLPNLVSSVLSMMWQTPVTTVRIAPFQYHVLALACFASLIAPFGGFFASGMKRALKVKDFGHYIPGHGGMTDRMDCQFMMGAFSYLYCQTFINIPTVSVGSLLQTAITGLAASQQVQLYRDLGQYLAVHDLLPSDDYQHPTWLGNGQGIVE
ncbi:phosphatidate cytidylyltransferase [Dispira simplex]|nr:phosphatidate cytidylyltransferase [Dispira simplex]